MGWLFGTVARCEDAKKEIEEAPKEENTVQEKVLSDSEDKKPDTAPTSGSANPASGGDNTGADPAVKEDEAEKAKMAQKGTTQASSSAGMSEPVSVRKRSHEEAQQKLEEHKESGGNKSSDTPEPEDEEAIQVKTVPYDPRFPATNQARNCYTRYNEYYKCIAEKDEDAPECKFYQRAYRSICPSEWVTSWNEARDEDRWFGKY